MTIVHIHNEIDNKGGTEVYLMQLEEVLKEYGHESYWVAIQEVDDQWRWCVKGESWEHCNKDQLLYNLMAWFRVHAIDLACIHNLFDDEIVDSIISHSATIKFSHSPVVICPGKDKYWRFSGKGCPRPYGLHCLYHAYTEGCTNRHPERL